MKATEVRTGRRQAPVGYLSAGFNGMCKSERGVAAPFLLIAFRLQVQCTRAQLHFA